MSTAADTIMRKLDAVVERLKGTNDRLPLSANVSAKLDLLNAQLEVARQRNSMYDEHRYYAAKEDFARWKGQEAQARSRAQADALFCADIRAAYQPIFEAYGEHPPMPIAGQDSESFRRKLMRTIRRKLSGFDERRVDKTGPTTVSQMAMLDGVDKRMSGEALSNFESLMVRAGALQADTPHTSTLPPPGEHVARHRVDPATGQKSTEYFGRESFIKAMSQPGQIVHRIMDPTTGNGPNWRGQDWTPADPPPGNAVAAAYKAAHPQAYVRNPGGPVAKTCVRVGNSFQNQPVEAYIQDPTGTTAAASRPPKASAKPAFTNSLMTRPARRAIP
jgi:hypothetical protein